MGPGNVGGARRQQTGGVCIVVSVMACYTLTQHTPIGRERAIARLGR